MRESGLVVKWKSILIAAIMIFFFLGCGDKSTNQQSGPALSSIAYGDCKVFIEKPGDVIVPPVECLEYQYDGSDTLRLTHINSLFNCCPDDLTAEITVEGESIVIIEREDLTSGGCDCTCYYDVDMKITGIIPGIYAVSVYGPYQDTARLQLYLDLSIEPSGIFCDSSELGDWEITPL